MTWVEPNICEVAEKVAECINLGRRNDAVRLSLRFYERFSKSDEATRVAITEGKPVNTGDARFDALLAGIVQYCCETYGMISPDWVLDKALYLSEPWFVSELQSLKTESVLATPAAFSKRGIYLSQNALSFA